MKTKRNKNNKGFSLIELIIAVAILVVLSGLLAPQLIKYIEKSREAKDMQAIDSVYVAMNTALADENAYDSFVKETATGGSLIKLTTDGMLVKEITDTANAFSDEFEGILGEADITLKSKRGAGTAGGNGHSKVLVKVTDNNHVVVWAAGASSDDKDDFTVGE